MVLPPLTPISTSGPVTGPLPQAQKTHHIRRGVSLIPPKDQHSNDSQWKNQMEDKMNSFDTKLNDLVDVLRSNQRLLVQQQEQFQLQQNSNLELENDTNMNSSLSRQISSESTYSSRSSDNENVSKRRKLTDDVFNDFRNDILTLDEAKDLFHFFDKNITPQLFGFEIAKFSVDTMWETSPILICAICTISSMHHPNSSLSSRHSMLSKHLHKLCGDLLYQGRPNTEVDAFNTILALIFCSFWLSDSQMFTGLALQMAKEVGLDRTDHSHHRNAPGTLNPKDRLKLWYLLYILDGQQSLTYNRQPLVNSREYSLQHSRSLLMPNDKTISSGENHAYLLPETEPEESKEEHREQPPSPTFTDMRIVSQVEYNQALSGAFAGNAWDLLTPASLGIPSKSNLELDKWMVSWTVLLSPMNNGAVWSSKSTLIYYNFAKMHINSSAVRQLQAKNPRSDNEFPKLDQLSQGPKRPEPPRPNTRSPVEEEKDWEDSSDDDEEFISNEELVHKDESTINANIAFTAAQTVLNLVLNDKDIKENLKYVPVHVHIMLYYASLLLVEDRISLEVDDDLASSFKKSIINLGTLSSLRQVISDNFPVDKNFGERLIISMDELIGDRTAKLKVSILDSDIDKTIKQKLAAQLSSVGETVSTKFELFEEKSTRGSSPGIYAWPGSNHGHPSQQ
ncbi:hypothetical protein PSN45_004956 [Yamadazyma tenuis]|nr:hypothetical protein PSN45_004956 [Yamadazyma tenuis]